MKRPFRHSLAILIGALALVATACSSNGSTPAASGSSAPTAQQSTVAGSAAGSTSAGTSTGTTGSASGAAAPKKLQKLRYGISGDLAVYWHVYVGQQMGYFKDHGIDLEKVTTRTGSATDLLSLLIGGEVDMADALPDPAIAAAANKADVSILNLTAPSAYSLIARKGIDSFAQLKALAKVKVAVSSPTTSIAGLSDLILEKEGIDPSKIELVVTGGTSARLAALESGSVDVGLLVQPADFKAESSGMKLLADSVNYAGWYGLTDIVMASTLSQKCGLYKDFFAAMRQVHEFLVDPANKQKAIDMVIAGTGSNQKNAELTYDLYMKDNAMPGVNDPTKTVTETATMLEKLGTKIPSNVSSLVNTTCTA